MSIKLFVSCDPKDHSREEKLLTSVPGVSFDVVYSNGSNKEAIAGCNAYIFAISLKSLHTTSCLAEFDYAKATLGIDKIYVTNMDLGLKPNFVFPASHPIWSILNNENRGGYGGIFKKVLANLALGGDEGEAPVVAKEEAPVVEAPVEEAPVVEAPVEEAPVVEAEPDEAPVVDAEPDMGGEVVDAEPDLGGEIVDADPDEEDMPFKNPDEV